MKHYLQHYAVDGRKIHIALAGCGGTGSQMLITLARMDLALRGLGGAGLIVDCFDPDTVSAANCGRQAFYTCDLGKNKAEVLAERLKLCFPGFEVIAYPEKFYARVGIPFLISCVDSRNARREICNSRHHLDCYHIDCGNGADYGQVLMGNGTKELPWPEIVEPELIASGPEDDTPSCSMAEALEKQDLFVNDFAARIAGALLWNMFRHGYTEIRGAYYTLNPLAVNPLKIEKTTRRGK